MKITQKEYLCCLCREKYIIGNADPETGIEYYCSNTNCNNMFALNSNNLKVFDFIHNWNKKYLSNNDYYFVPIFQYSREQFPKISIFTPDYYWMSNCHSLTGNCPGKNDPTAITFGYLGFENCKRAMNFPRDGYCCRYCGADLRPWHLKKKNKYSSIILKKLGGIIPADWKV